jgi:hypothetical protein
VCDLVFNHRVITTDWTLLICSFITQYVSVIICSSSSGTFVVLFRKLVHYKQQSHSVLTKIKKLCILLMLKLRFEFKLELVLPSY